MLILAVRAHDALIVMITTWMSTVHSEMSDRTLPGGGFPSFNSLLPLNALCNGAAIAHRRMTRPTSVFSGPGLA